MQRSVTAIISLAVVVVLVVALLNYWVCSNIDTTIIQIKQQIDQEIIDRRLGFDSPEERHAYKDKRLEEHLAARGLDICS